MITSDLKALPLDDLHNLARLHFMGMADIVAELIARQGDGFGLTAEIEKHRILSVFQREAA